MANTPLGYPYPVGTDRVMDGDNAIRSLAEAVEQKQGTSAGGAATVPISNGQAEGTVAVTFPVGRFTAIPIVVATVQAANSAWTLTNAYGVTAAGCTLKLGHRDGTPSGSNTSFPVAWLATQY